MPNYIANRLTFYGKKEQVEQLINIVKTKKSEFDFNQIIPMPKSLDIVSGTATDSGMNYLLLKSKGHTIGFTDSDYQLITRMEAKRDSEKPEEREDFARCIKLGRAALQNIAKYDYPTWYEWCTKNWGTKWNACEVRVSTGGHSVYFETAWNFPYPVIKHLSEMFPEVKINFVFADEDCGSNTGCGTFVAGEAVKEEYPDTGSKHAYELYIKAWGECDWLVYDETIDNYRYVDEEELETTKENLGEDVPALDK